MNISCLMQVNNTDTRLKHPSFKTNYRSYTQQNDDTMRCITRLFRDDLDWNGFSNFVLKNFKDKDKVNIVMFAASDGSEAYSTIISLLENCTDKKTAVQKFFPIRAYDIDEEILKAARSGYVNTISCDRMDLLMNCNNYYNYFSNTDNPLFIPDDTANKDTKTFKAKRILTDNVRFNQGDMFLKIQELEDSSNTVLMCRNSLGYFENDKIESFIKLAAERLKSGSVFVIGNHDSVLFNIDECLKSFGFEKVMHNVYKKT